MREDREQRLHGRTPKQVPDEDAFVICPENFLLDMGPEEYKARQALYQLAFERAIARMNQPKPFVPPFEFEHRDGI